MKWPFEDMAVPWETTAWEAGLPSENALIRGAVSPVDKGTHVHSDFSSPGLLKRIQ